MTFTLTEECIFCGKPRVTKTLEKEHWKTLESVFEVREDREPRIGSGIVVTVCRECRPKYTVEEFIAKARKVW